MNKFLRLISAALAALLLSAPAFEIIHNQAHGHSLCAEHLGEWIDSHASHAEQTKPTPATPTFTNSSDSEQTGEHAACAWLAARERAGVFGKSESATSILYFSLPLSVVRSNSLRKLAVYRLAPKTSPPRLS